VRNVSHACGMNEAVVSVGRLLICYRRDGAAAEEQRQSFATTPACFRPHRIL